jgi:hypothetical protein
MFCSSVKKAVSVSGYRHRPEPHLERLAKVLKVPTPYSYTREEDLARIILRFGAPSAAERRRLARTMT